MRVIIKYSQCKTVLGSTIHDFTVFIDNLRLRNFSSMGGHTSEETQAMADAYAKALASKLNLLIIRE